MSRVPPAPLDGPGADDRNVARIAELRAGRISTLYQVLLHSGDVAAGWCSLGTAIRYRSSLPDALRELVICRVAEATGATYEWFHHAPIARDAGVTAAQLDAIGGWRDTDLFDDDQQAALALTEAVVAGAVDDATFEDAEQRFGRRGVVELVATAAYYLAVSRFLQACDVTPD